MTEEEVTLWPGKNRDQWFEIADAWSPYIISRGDFWHITVEDQDGFEADREDAHTKAAAAKMSGSKSHLVVVAAQHACDKLESTMRRLKRLYLRMPPLTQTEWDAMLLAPDNPPSIILASILFVTGVLKAIGSHLLVLYLKCTSGKVLHPGPPEQAVNVAWGVRPQGGATPEQALGPHHYLVDLPHTGDDMWNHFTTRKASVRNIFGGDEAGMTAFFCMRYENAKGEWGDWGPMVSAVIPL